MTYSSITSFNFSKDDTGTTQTAVMPATVNAGETLVWLIYTYGTISTPPSGWTLANSAAQSYLYTKTATGDEAGTSVNFTLAATGTSFNSVFSIQGCGGAYTSPNTLYVDPPALTSGFGAVETMWIALTLGGNFATAAPSGYSGLATDSDAYRTSYAYKNSIASSENPGGFTVSDSSTHTCWTLAIKGVTQNNALFFGSNF